MIVAPQKTEAFTLIVQRKRIDDDENPYWNTLINSDDETGVRGHYKYRAIATNLDDLSDPEVVHFYNQRGEASENRIKELRSDFAALIVRHARQWTVKVNACHRKVMDEVLDHIRGFPLLL